MRRSYLTATDAGTLLGQNKYQTPEELKTKKLGSIPTQTNTMMAQGINMELEALQEYAKLRPDVRLFTIGLVVHDNDKFAASPDALAGLDSDTGGVVEVKSPHWAIRKEIPPAHLTQMYVNMACLGRKWCDYVQYKPHSPIDIKRVEWDDAVWNELLPRLEAAYAYLFE